MLKVGNHPENLLAASCCCCCCCWKNGMSLCPATYLRFESIFVCGPVLQWLFQYDGSQPIEEDDAWPQSSSRLFECILLKTRMLVKAS